MGGLPDFTLVGVQDLWQPSIDAKEEKFEGGLWAIMYPPIGSSNDEPCLTWGIHRLGFLQHKLYMGI